MSTPGGSRYLHTRLPYRYMVYYAPNTTGGERVIVYAARVSVEHGALVFYDDGGTVLTVYAEGTWNWCHLVDADDNRISRTA